MVDNGESHDRGDCDSCGARGVKLGWVVGLPDRTHKHACTDVACRDALERGVANDA